MKPGRAERRTACLAANDDAVMAASTAAANAIGWTSRLHSLSVLTFSGRFNPPIQ
jgi:hypothetical protein